MELDADSIRWIEQVTGLSVIGAAKVPGGASRQSYFVDFAESGRIGARAFLRMDTGSGGMSGTIFTLEREARLLRALQGTGVRVPLLYAAEGPRVLLECARGSSDYSLAAGEHEPAIVRQLMGQLATLHALRLDFAAVLGDGEIATVAEALAADLDLWASLLAARAPHADRLIGNAFAWLRANLPGDADSPPVLVHGDIGVGNFMVEDGEVTALIDWEIAHAGHPLEDLACIIARTLGAPLSDTETLIGEYARATGTAVDRVALRYCLVLVLTRFSIGIAMALEAPDTATDVPMLVKFSQLNLNALARLLAEAEGLAIPPASLESMPADDDRTLLHGHMAAVLAEMAGTAADPYSAHRLRGLSDLSKYLRDLAPLSVPDDPAGSGALLPNIARIRLRHRQMREMLGPMYDRRIVLEQEIGQ